MRPLSILAFFDLISLVRSWFSAEAAGCGRGLGIVMCLGGQGCLSGFVVEVDQVDGVDGSYGLGGLGRAAPEFW